MNIERIMEGLGEQGITVILKVDHERLAEHGAPWTLVLSGPAMTTGGFIRAESTSVADVLRQCVHRLAEYPGDWAWLLNEVGA